MMGLIDWLLGRKRVRRIPRPSLSDITPPIPGDDGYPATEAQLLALAKLECGQPPGNISLQQASSILSARDYSNYVIEAAQTVRIDRAAYYDLHANVIALIVTTPTLRDAAHHWSQRNYDEGDENPPRRDKHWKTIVHAIEPALAFLEERQL